MFIQLRLKLCLQYQKPKSAGILISSYHPPSPPKIEVSSWKTQKTSPCYAKLEVKCMSQNGAQSWQLLSQPTVFPAAETDAFLLCMHSHFLHITKKIFSEEQKKWTKNRGLELGNENKQKNKSLIKGRCKIWQGLNGEEWIFTFFFSSSKNLNPSALSKPRTCSNSSFVDFPDNRAAESHLIHLWDLVRTSKYNRLQNTWNCWHCKHFLPNSVGQQTQSRPCNYIPPQSTFAVM